MTVSSLERLLLRMNEKTHLGLWGVCPDLSVIPEKLGLENEEDNLPPVTTKNTIVLDEYARQKISPAWLGTSKIFMTSGD